MFSICLCHVCHGILWMIDEMSQYGWKFTGSWLVFLQESERVIFSVPCTLFDSLSTFLSCYCIHTYQKPEIMTRFTDRWWMFYVLFCCFMWWHQPALSAVDQGNVLLYTVCVSNKNKILFCEVVCHVFAAFHFEVSGNSGEKKCLSRKCLSHYPRQQIQ